MIKDQIPQFQQAIGAYSAKLVAVSKTKPIEDLQSAYEAGQRLFGENKVQELVEKEAALPKDIEWHMIGHLQTNKVKYIAPFVSLIHAVDSPKLFKEIQKQGKKIGRVIPVLLQVHIAQETQKFGFEHATVESFLENVPDEERSFVAIKGFMGMATYTPDQEQIATEFRSLRELATSMRTKFGFVGNELSMGMSGDYRIALEYGSTLVRIGSAIFGSRS